MTTVTLIYFEITIGRTYGERKNFHNNKFKAAATLLHQIKDSAGNVRAKEIANYALAAEEAIRTHNIEMLRSLLREIDQLLDALNTTREGGLSQ